MRWELNSSAPIYAQLVGVLKHAIASGELEPGDRLPSIRDLAMEAGVNPNTMQRALAELEREGLVTTQRTSGKFVTEDQEMIIKIKTELAKGLVREFIDSMNQLGYTRGEIVALINGEEEKTDGDIGMSGAV